ncbi:hypothetical protein QYF36_015128 [Acer negundo]|nr:hypothetical protein QYF36_015128 [Acer negundo]
MGYSSRIFLSSADDYVYDYYTVNDDMKVDDDDGSNPFPLVQIDDEDYYDGPDESGYESEDSNAENNPQNDYSDEISGEEEEEEEEEDDGVGSKASNESEDSSEGGSVNVSRDLDLLHVDDLYYDDLMSRVMILMSKMIILITMMIMIMSVVMVQMAKIGDGPIGESW